MSKRAVWECNIPPGLMRKFRERYGSSRSARSQMTTKFLRRLLAEPRVTPPQEPSPYREEGK